MLEIVNSFACIIILNNYVSAYLILYSALRRKSQKNTREQIEENGLHPFTKYKRVEGRRCLCRKMHGNMAVRMSG